MGGTREESVEAMEEKVAQGLEEAESGVKGTVDDDAGTMLLR